MSVNRGPRIDRLVKTKHKSVMSQYILQGVSGNNYPIHTRNINWKFDPSADAMDETKDVVLIVCV